MIGLALLWVYLRRNEAFTRFRNTILLANVIGLVGYVLLPTAPPRLFTAFGFEDTLGQFGGLNHGSGLVELAANPYAAMPSLHAADALIVGVVLASVVRHWLVKVLWLLWPVVGLVRRHGDGQPLLARRRRRRRASARSPLAIIYRRRIRASSHASSLIAECYERVRRTPPGQAGLHDGRALACVALDRRARAHARDAERADHRRRVALPRGGSARLLRVPQRVALLLARRRPCSSSARSSTSSTARSPAPAARRRRSAPSSTRPPTGSARASMLGAIALVFSRQGNEVALASAVRRGRRLVPRQLHARQGRGARAQGRRRDRLARRARRGDHGRARARAVGRAAVGDLPARRHGLVHRGPADPGRPHAAATMTSRLVRASTISAISLIAQGASSFGCPRALKSRLGRRGRAPAAALNDVAVGILASRFAVPFAAERPRAGRSRAHGAVLVLPAACPQRAEGQARRARGAAQAKPQRDLDRRDARRAARKGTPWHQRTARRRASEDKVRVAIIGVGNCANSLLQGVEYYKDAPDDQFVPGLMHVEPRRLPRPRHRVHRRVRRDEGQGRQGPRRRDLGAPERHDQVRRRPEDRHQGLRAA